jgi:hypothetical protein
MGLSIHYSGKIRNKAMLPELIAEVKEIAEHYKWPYAIEEQEFSEKEFDESDPKQPIYGIYFSPPDCETICFTFLSNGLMCNPFSVKIFAAEKNERKYMYMIATKTQYAGVEVHQKIVLLFRYITKKYLTEFKMFDESEYWETGDEKLMVLNFERYNTLVGNFALALQSLPARSNESMHEYLTRVFGRVHKDFKKRFEK